MKYYVLHTRIKTCCLWFVVIMVYPTRNKTLLHPEDKHNTNMFQRGLCYNACKFYNALSEEIKCVNGIHQF